MSTKNKGFSLLELIIAVGILAAGIVVVLQAFSFSARITGLSGDIVNAVFLAEDKIQELEFNLSQKSIDLDKELTKTGVENDKFNWEYQLLDLKPDLNLYKLNFQISWERLNRNETLSLNTYLRQ